MRLTIVTLAVALSIGSTSVVAAKCPTGNSLAQVGTTSRSAEQNTFGYTCVDATGSIADVPERVMDRPVEAIGPDLGDPEKQTYGYLPPPSRK